MRRLIVWIVLLGGLAIATSAAGLSDKNPQEQSRTLVGHVFDANDAPIAKAIVYLKNTKTEVIKTYITDPSGSYRFPGLSPSIDYEVHAEFNGRQSARKILSLLDGRKQPEITLRIQ